MSMQARMFLVNSRNTILSDLQRSDFLDPNKVNTNLVALVLDLIGKGHIIQFTAVNSDHHDDRHLSRIPPYAGTHTAGYAFDCWPLAVNVADSWLRSEVSDFQRFLQDVARSPWTMQIGLAGDADNRINEIAAGSLWFPDSGADHIHIGVHA